MQWFRGHWNAYFLFCWNFYSINSFRAQIMYWLLWVSENSYDYKLNSPCFQKKKKKKNEWFENFNIITPHPYVANRVVENLEMSVCSI